jgi:catechol 2,3-dioxygenase-like lactoylglutathione lyase family enzyme
MAVAALDHVLLLSDDIDATRDFYCRTTGMEVGDRPPLPFPGYWLYAGGRPCLHIADRAVYTAHARSVGLDLAPPGEERIDHLAFSASDYDEAAQRLEREGVAAVRNAVPGAGLRQLFFSDPLGMRVEINVFEGATAQ